MTTTRDGARALDKEMRAGARDADASRALGMFFSLFVVVGYTNVYLRINRLRVWPPPPPP